ncbi:MAG TPA: SigE family RNA polymerase sigma factor [Micromonosporaceae bacterium]
MDARAEREFREYVSARQAALYRVAYLLTGHRQDAEDLLQTALAKLALHWTNVASAGCTDAYVRKILYHQQVSWWRSRRHRSELATADPPENSGVGDLAGDSSLRLTLEQMLARLTKRQRAVLILRYYEDLAEADVAEILGCGVGTVRSQTHRALARLRTLGGELISIKETA